MKRRGKGDAALAAGLEFEADHANDVPQPDWDGLGLIREQVVELREKGELSEARRIALFSQVERLIPKDRTDLLEEYRQKIWDAG